MNKLVLARSLEFWKDILDGRLPHVYDDECFDPRRTQVRIAARDGYSIDPASRRQHQQFFDEISVHYLLKAGLDSRLYGRIATTMTRSSADFSRKMAGLDYLSQNGVLADWDPPDCISQEMLSRHTLAAQHAFQFKNWKITPITALRFPMTARAGYGYDGSRGDNMNLAFTKFKTMMRHFNANTITADSFPPYEALTRCQLAEIAEGSKTRLVWAVSFHALMLQLAVLQHGYDVWADRDTPTCFGATMDDRSRRLHRFVAETSTADDNSVTAITDWPAFDTGKLIGDQFVKGVQPWELLLFIRLVALAYIRYAKGKHRAIMALMLRMLMMELICKRLITADTTYYVNGLVPSGHGGTYMVDSVLNWTRLQIWADYTRVILLNTIVGGDDGIMRLVFDMLNWAKSVQEPMMALFGTYLREPPKSIVGVDPSDMIFHGHSYLLSGPSRQTETMLALLIHRERTSLLWTDDDRYQSLEPFRTHRSIALGRMTSLYEDCGARWGLLARAIAIFKAEWPDCMPRQELLREFIAPDLALGL